jgi:hypothetical protein
MSESYPCALPLPLVDSFSYEDQDTVEFNDLDSGPPVARRRTSEGYTTFRAVFSFSGAQTQVFKAWYRHSVKGGSKTFTIDLNLDGELTQHTCYMRNPKYQMAGKRWRVSALMISTQREGLNECDSISLINLHNGIEAPVSAALESMEDLVENVL